MKIISLNIWAGKEREGLLSFLERTKGDTDVFCFQEVMFGSQPVFTPENKGRENIFSEVSEALAGFSSYIYKAPPGSYFAGESITCDIGQAIFVKDSLAGHILESGGFRTYSDASPIAKDLNVTLTGNCQWIKIKSSADEKLGLTLLNLHGLWQDKSEKLDTPERLEQVKTIKDFLAVENSKKILIGDFNMRPEIKSMDILREGMIDLITENGVVSTRSNLYRKPIQYSDYAFVSPGVSIKDFKVLSDEVSDHLPLYLEIE